MVNGRAFARQGEITMTREHDGAHPLAARPEPHPEGDLGPQRGREIRARKMSFPFGATIPRHWFVGSPFATHMANGLNLLFPLGERFFVRSVRRYLDRIDDPELLAQVKGFIAQEVRHGMEHERFFEILEAQGFRIRTYLRVYDAIAFGFLERIFPDRLALSVTVAAEHFTATMAHTALTRDFLAKAHPVMRELFQWHAAEEIEHKSVAFDVLRKVDDSYALRVAGLILATSTLMPFWFSAAIMLMVQDREVSTGELLRDRRAIRDARREDNEQLKRAFVEYLRRDFHPSQNDDAALARRFFEKLSQARADAAE